MAITLTPTAASDSRHLRGEHASEAVYTRPELPPQPGATSFAEPSPDSEESAEVDLDQRSVKSRLLVVLSGGILMTASLAMNLTRPTQSEPAAILAMLGALIAAAPVLLDAVRGVRAEGFEATRFYMDQFIAFAVVACFAVGEYTTAGTVAIVLIVGQIMEERSALGAREAAHSLLKLSRVTVRRLRAGMEELVDSQHLVKDDLFRLRAGDTVPADAIVVSGASSMNQAAITGESLPVDVTVGDKIYAGTSNLTGLLEARVERAGDDTLLGRVRHIILEAQTSRAPIMRRAENYIRLYTPLVLVTAGLVLFFTEDINRAISVIIVSIPCAFVLASPTAMVAALAVCTRFGVLVKSTRLLEIANQVDTVVFDKTGTLTTGQLRVESLTTLAAVDHPESQEPPERLLSLACMAAGHSTHPAAQALARYGAALGWRDEDLPSRPLERFEEIPGLGLSVRMEGHEIRIGRSGWVLAQCPGKSRKEGDARLSQPGADSGSVASVLSVAVDGQYIAEAHISDTIRPEARGAIDDLRELGVRHFVMLTGDREAAARPVANSVGIESYTANCLPDDKLEAVRQSSHSGRIVMVVGDGINDAPALAAGHISVAMGAMGSDIAIKTADIALIASDLTRLPGLLLVASRTLAIINQNLLSGLVFIVLAATLSALGWVSPIAAAFIHEFGAFFVIFNSARLLRFDFEVVRHAPGADVQIGKEPFVKRHD